MRFLRIHPVQKVINNPTQLSGRGFPRIFHMELFSSQLYVFWYSKIEAEPCNSKICKSEFCCFWILQFWNFEFSNLKILELWNFDVWNFEIMNFKCWCVLTILFFFNVKMLILFLKFWNLEFWNYEIWNCYILHFRNFEILNFEILNCVF